jgi:hypothetical protein
MPLRRMLEGRNFDPKAAAVIVKAFNEIIDELYLRTPAERERAARIVIRLAAKEAELDVAKLRDEVVSLLRGERGFYATLPQGEVAMPASTP